jgi:hypothetical protein
MSARICRDECVIQIAVEVARTPVSLLHVKFSRAAASRLMTVGMLSAGWYSILTGSVLLYLAYLLGRIPWDVDRAALSYRWRSRSRVCGN